MGDLGILSGLYGIILSLAGVVASFLLGRWNGMKTSEKCDVLEDAESAVSSGDKDTVIKGALHILHKHLLEDPNYTEDVFGNYEALKQAVVNSDSNGVTAEDFEE